MGGNLSEIKIFSAWGLRERRVTCLCLEPLYLNKKGPASVLCDHLEGWDREGGRETQEGGVRGIYVYYS